MNRSVAGLAFALLATACGLADDPQDERNKSVYPTFFDKTFEAYCIETFDLDGNGRISRYEAQRVRDVSCPGLGIVSLADLREFPNLERLDCSQNAITELDLSPCTRLVRLDCRGNGLVRLDVEGLRGLTEADCRDNALQQLDLTSNGSLGRLDLRRNDLRTLDVSACAATLQADVRENPGLGTVYCRQTQGISFDGGTQLQYR
ncbi:MAG TPA: leucine-rich repeat domain-containing protein [Candidatus Alistipes intestinigallinarum]|uniref:Leucine-rich repeat domain-containing protein n=1 Tax=Candidatus Alistipes intestinigallinarum TaxID=2838440 RepID=A0A9D1YZW2_9BACT|nr:leucine-rich repeat domain-containing protein [Candidatus Alistipes intestinigallinarum]